MRTERPSPLALAAARLRGPAARARRWFAERGTPTRVGLLAAIVAAVGVAGYLASGDDPGRRAPAWLFEGRRLSADDLGRVADALEAEGIDRVVDKAAGKVGVKAEVVTAARAALAKRKVVPRTLEDLGGDEEAESPWISPADREGRKLRRLEQALKFQIEGLDPAIVSANVRIHREKGRGFPAAPRVAAFVYLKIEGRLGHRVADGIETFLTGDLPDLRPEAITVADQYGNKYLAAGDPALKEQNKAHHKEEDWREKILDGLRHIPGVTVSVLLRQVAPPPSPPVVVIEPPPAPPAELVVPNGKVAVALDPPPAPAPAAPAPAAPRDRANVVVQVPRSFYRREFQSKRPDRQPTQEEIVPMAATTRNIVEDVVRINIPEETLGEIKVDTVQDDLFVAEFPPDPDSRRAWLWPALSGGLALASATALAAVLLRRAGRRSSDRPAPSAWRPGIVDDGPNGPSPGASERVRELIRLNPEAAAGVLQRWIGQGGAIG